MDGQVEVRCRCGEVRGIVTDPSPRTVNRVTCYCDDCQAFAHELGRADLLNKNGGSDIIQVAPAAVSFTKGQDRIVGLRLTPKGLYRWYAKCCNTPVGNTLGPAVPFVGLFAEILDVPKPDEVVGPPTGAIMGKYAVGEAPAGSSGIKLSLMLGAIGRVIGWRLSGKTWPHPFFAQETRVPIYPITVVSKERRDALRAFCGPHPTAQAAP
ncbi:MAG TPA: DUF6151 family protein [Bradyrhizobium sp.]|uniref:DUF6151 family protein n=1 Tax=Bradyrhizobium sp. TaxID=376 RepID=UPI002C73C1D8|nr:DUF6151 family protein [Bradyrhizobium sp.]HLZ01782.1 DUF6151 family protein [Bradyrhizobium sp.]